MNRVDRLESVANPRRAVLLCELVYESAEAPRNENKRSSEDRGLVEWHPHFLDVMAPSRPAGSRHGGLPLGTQARAARPKTSPSMHRATFNELGRFESESRKLSAGGP